MPPLRTATLYLALGQPAIIAAQHYNAAGIHFEQADPAVVTSNNWGEVALRLREALQKFSMQDRDLRAARLTDWPSYQASGISSVDQFALQYLRVEVRAVNDAELFYEASAKPQGEEHLTFQILLNPYREDEEIGRHLGKLFVSCLKWSAMEFG